MSDIVAGVRQLKQDLIVPDLKAIIARQDAMERRFDGVDQHLSLQDKKNMALQIEVLMKTLEAFRSEMRSEFAILRSDLRLELALIRRAGQLRFRVGDQFIRFRI